MAGQIATPKVYAAEREAGLGEAIAQARCCTLIARLKTAPPIAPGKGGVNTVDYMADPSGVQAVGVLLHAIEAEPVTSFKRKNYHTNAQWPGDPVSLLRRGWVVTDQIVGSPVAGSGAFLGASGQLSTSQAAGAPQVGRFETTKDVDGFARVFLDI